jgi:hypothetical protein
LEDIKGGEDRSDVFSDAEGAWILVFTSRLHHNTYLNKSISQHKIDFIFFLHYDISRLMALSLRQIRLT